MLTSFTEARPGLHVCCRHSVPQQANPRTEHRLLIFATTSGVKTQGKWRKLHKQEPCWVMLLSQLHCMQSKELHTGHEFSCRVMLLSQLHCMQSKELHTGHEFSCRVMLLSQLHCMQSKELHTGHEFSCIRYVRKNQRHCGNTKLQKGFCILPCFQAFYRSVCTQTWGGKIKEGLG